MPRREWLSGNVLALGLVSLFTDSATEMVIPLLPTFITTVLGGGALALGWIEGLADSVASLLKLFSGRWADRLGRNRPFVLIGYGLSSTVRPLLALAASPLHVLLVRTGDRVGKGLRSSPRDALIAASISKEQRGAAFGFHRSMDHAGAVIGPLLALVLLLFFKDNLRLIFALTIVPGICSILAIVWGVKEPKKIDDKIDEKIISASNDYRPLARFLIPLSLFTLANSSDTFLLLQAGALHSSLITLPLLWMGLHVVKTISSTYGGLLADRLGKKRTIGLGWLVYIVIYLGFAYAQTTAAIWSLFIVYGLYHGLSEGPEKALVADLAPPARAGTAFGWYNLILGLCALPASVFFGWMYQNHGSRSAFLFSAMMAIAAWICLQIMVPNNKFSRRIA